MNILMLIIDSLNYSHVKKSKINLMPYFQELKRTGITCENMYSQAPYTEAAVMNLYCGQDVLQNNGYIFRFKNAESTIFEEMHNAGYITYYNSYQPQCHPSSVRRGIDYLYYNVGYDQSALWSYRLSHYANLYNSNSLNDKDYEIIREIMEDNFVEWIRFTDDILTNHESTNMIIRNAPEYNALKVKELVYTEYLSFKADNIKYIENVLREGLAHRIFKIPAYNQKKKIQDREVIPRIQEEMRPLFKRINAMDTRLNLCNCKGLLKGPIRKFGNLLCNPSKIAYKEFLKSGYLVLNELKDIDLFQRIEEDCDWFKNAPSGRTHIDHYLKWAEQHKDDGKHFACIHIDDIHNPEVFFTYDSEDMDLIRKEKRIAEEVLDSIPKSYYGSLTHDLSLRYIDNLIEYLFEALDKKGMLEDTCIAICADHGFSFSGNPLRDSFVINLYLENYNIPCLISGSGYEQRTIYGLHTSKDLPATLCRIATGEVPAAFSGHSLTDAFEYSEVYIEYCGGGCPDLTRRELKIAAFDKTYFVGTLCSLNEELGDKSITEIYDLNEDPMQLNNLKNGKYDLKKVSHLLQCIRVRRGEIRASMES